MRTTLLAGLLALLLPACLVGVGEIGGDDTGSTGTGTGGGGGGGGGDGSGNGSGSGSNQPTPRISATVDKTAISTELGKTETLTVTVTGENGFAGPVTVTPTVLDSSGNPITGWTMTPTPATLDMASGDSQTVTLDVKIPTDTVALDPTVQVELTSSADPVDVTSAFTVANQVTIVIPAGTGSQGPHAGLPAKNSPIRIHAGTKIIFHNADNIQHVIHGDGGIPHENLNAGQPGTDYVVTPSDSATWYCHDHEGSSSSRPVEIIP